MSVLLVDAGARRRSHISALLQDQKIHVTNAATVVEAQTALVLRTFDVVIVELTLPDGTALDVLDRLRTSRSTSHVIVLGGSTDEADRVRVLERGADDFVVTPCSLVELTARVLAVRRRRDAVADRLLQIDRLDIELPRLDRDGSVVETPSLTARVRDDAGAPMGIVSVSRAAVDALRARSLERDTSLAGRLRQALADDEFEVHYQPIVDLVHGRLITLEALARWEHPERGTLPPAAFLDTAERSGLIIALGERVLDKACRQAAEWRRSGADIHLSVNVSTHQLADPGMVERFTTIMRDSGFDPACLWLEVTETAAVEEFEKASDALRRLVELGVGVSIDDFGTGWASLTYLQSFPVHALKIDRSFVGRAGQSAHDTAIVRSILSLGAELGLFVVAEGIETQAQHDEMKKLGCSFGQGYLFGRPTPGCDVPIERAARITADAPDRSDISAP